eukprot:m.92314 g.92314  ORF g.92314 m.92314 type:complete len:970 (+) comp26538_c0_seq3:131-3040(+)
MHQGQRSRFLFVLVVTGICTADVIPTVKVDKSLPDWLNTPDPRNATSTVTVTNLDENTISLSNGFLARVFVISPFFVTWDIATLKGSALRGLSAEGTITLDNATYDIGGAFPINDDGTACPLPVGIGPSNNCPTAYFNRSIEYAPNTSAFMYTSHWTSQPTAPFPWKQARHAPDMPWPPLGLRLSVNFTAPKSAPTRHQGIVITMNYEMYQGAPILSKWMDVHMLPSAAELSNQKKQNQNQKPKLKQKRKQLKNVPSDQQGPVCIQPCTMTLPPSDWESRWELMPMPGNMVMIKLQGPQSLCLSPVHGTAYHSFNDDVDVVSCNATDTLQHWSVNTSASTIETRATPAALAALGHVGICGMYPSNPCSIDVNNHQDDSSTTTAMTPSSVPIWKFVNQSVEAASGNSIGQFQLLAYGSSGTQCIWHTPLPPPPPSPPPPPPKLPCDVGCVLVSGAHIEILRLNQPWAPSPALNGNYGGPSNDGLLAVHSSQALNHGTIIQWGTDPTFDPEYSGNDGSIQPMVVVGYADKASYGGPAARVRVGGSFTSFRSIELFADSVEPERLGLSLRKRTRMLAPQTSEAPLFMHLTDVSASGVKSAVDQMVDVGGFDMLIFSFGSGFQLENESPEYVAGIKASVAYANAHGIEVGGYDLIALSRGGTGYDTINPLTGQPSGSACFASNWNLELLNKTLTFIAETGLSMVETDGPYGGTPCGSTSHNHYDAYDSIQRQWQNQVDFYEQLRKLGVFVHAPDDYVFAGGANKNCGWYSEMQFSLPRWQWISISHSEVFDHTFAQTPTQTWMFAPLIDYHSGGAPAALEPFTQHSQAWEWTLATYIGAGVGACYRGNELYDTPQVKAIVSKWTLFWVKYRSILTQDIIHVQRPDMQSVDVLMHVTANKTEPIAALAVFYNPSMMSQNSTFDLNLYYTGETGSVKVLMEDVQPARIVPLERDYSISVAVNMAPRTITYVVVRR